MDFRHMNSSCPELLFANFNQDCKCFVVGTKRGFRIFNCDPLRQKEESKADDDGSGEALTGQGETVGKDMGVICAEMLFRCNFVAFVASEEPKRVQVWDDFRRRVVMAIDVDHEVKAVKLRRDRVVVVTSSQVQVFTLTGSPTRLNAFDTVVNTRGLCALAPSADRAVLAFPAQAGQFASEGAHGAGNSKGNSAQGNVRIVDLNKSTVDSDSQGSLIVAAHEANLSCLAINISGSHLATASEKGTLIRLFNTENGQLINELRRGTQPANIHCINFSADSRLLCVSSSHGTIHVFSAGGCDDGGKNKQAPFAKNAHINGLLPKYFSSEWSFSRIEVPGGTPCICAFGDSPNSVIAVCADGSYNKFSFEPEKGRAVRDVYQMIFEVGKS